MPRHPETSSSVAAIGGALYSALADRLASCRGEVYPLHVGDTWLEPAQGCRMQDLTVEDHPGMHRYAHPQGMPALIDAIVERTRVRTGVDVERGNVLVSAGATGGLAAVTGAILDPGDEVLILAPYWPLITGIVRCSNATPVTVPFTDVADSAETAVDVVEQRRTERTVALYVSSPNNPTGRTIPRRWLERLVEWAARHDLWVIADEVYEDYVYEESHTYSLALDPARTFSAHSFSKAFGMAGNRCGYVIGPAATLGESCKVSTHSCYSTPTASQLAACRALDGRGDRWVGEVKDQYRSMGSLAAHRLGVDPPQGSTFLFLDVGSRLDSRGLLGFLEDCADSGLFLAPGPSFGPYPHHVRICFTSAAPPVVERGVDVLAGLLAR